MGIRLVDFIASEDWAVYKLDCPNRKYFGDTAFGPMWKTLPEEVIIDDLNLVIDDHISVERWIQENILL